MSVLSSVVLKKLRVQHDTIRSINILLILHS